MSSRAFLSAFLNSKAYAKFEWYTSSGKTSLETAHFDVTISLILRTFSYATLFVGSLPTYVRKIKEALPSYSFKLFES